MLSEHLALRLKLFAAALFFVALPCYPVTADSLTARLAGIRAEVETAAAEAGVLGAELVAAQADVLRLDAQRKQALADLTTERVLSEDRRAKLEAAGAALAAAQARVAALEDALRECQAPALEPEPVTLDAEVTLAGLGTLRTTGPGVATGKALRWTADVSPEVRVQVDLLGSQVRVTTARCWSDVPFEAPPLETRLTIKLDGATVYDAPLRLHPHTAPSMVFRGLAPPAFDLRALEARGAIPTYSPAAKPTEATLAAMAAGKAPWTRWNPTGGYDRFSEEYNITTRSWTGGTEWGNEAAMLNPTDVAYLLSGDPRAWRAVSDLATSSGVYPIHYWDRRTGKPLRPEDAGSLRFGAASKLVGDGLNPRLKTAAGVAHPVADPAHAHPLVYLAALLTGDPYLVEEQQSWTLLYALMKEGTARTSADVASGQVRAYAWGLRTQLQAYLVSSGADREEAAARLRRNFTNFTVRVATPGAAEYRRDGLFGTIKPKSTNPNLMLRYIASPETMVVSLWNYSAFALVAGQCMRAGFPEAIPARDHAILVARGWWEAIPSPYLAGWGNCAAAPSQLWADSARLTFEGLAALPTAVSAPVDMLYLGFYRAAVVTAAQAGQVWAAPALAWIDSHLPSGKSIPPAWALVP